MNNHAFFITILIFSVSSVAMAQDNTIYVSPSGGDANLGTSEQPFANLEKARDTIRQRRTSNDKPYTVIVKGGNYFVDETIRFDERDSNVTYKAALGEKPVVYGGTRITGWKKWQGNIYRASVPKGKRFFRLMHNQDAAVMARHLNKGSGYGDFGKRNNTTIAIPDKYKNCDYSDAQLFGFIGSNWFSEMREVLSSDGHNLKADDASCQRTAYSVSCIQRIV